MALIVRCAGCHKTFELAATPDQIRRWRAGEHIQNVMPNLTPGERELLISQTCNSCWDKMWEAAT